MNTVSSVLRVLFAEHNPFDVVDSAEQALERRLKSPDEATSYDVVSMDYRLPGVDAMGAIKVRK